jgi:hypothetical protein
MATLNTSTPLPNPTRPPGESSAAKTIARLLPVLLTPVVLLVHGYHPFAGDAGIYTAGVRHILNPALYPRNAAFVTAFTHRSLFPWILAALVRLTHLPLAWILLATHLFSMWLFLAAAAHLASRLFPSPSARLFSTLLAAACCALPVAGTALVLMDPYVTSRSFSTPLSLLAVTAALDRRWSRTLLLTALALVFHPLMGVYTAAFVLLQTLIASARARIALIVCAAACILAGLAFALAHNTPSGPAYRQAVSLAPRSFLFLARWRWFEVLGLLLPLTLFALARRRLAPNKPPGVLCLTSILLGTTALLIAACFVPPAGPYLLVPFQVLRSVHLIYCIGVILCGGVFVLRARWLTPALVVLLFAGMFQVERLQWPGNRRLELPGLAPANPYTQAFLWIRTHTPPDAVFAFNPRLVYSPGEDEQGFRALSERDQLADDKDAGVAAVLPALAPRWAAQRNAEFSVDQMSDAERLTTLAPLGATWLLLPPAAPTALPCPWRNRAVQVCRLQP